MLDQVASVVEGPELKRGDGSVNGHSGIVFTVVKQPHVDTRRLTGRRGSRLRRSRGIVAADIIINSELFRLKNFIDRGIFNVGEALVIGATLVIICFVSFLAQLPNDLHHSHRDTHVVGDDDAGISHRQLAQWK